MAFALRISKFSNRFNINKFSINRHKYALVSKFETFNTQQNIVRGLSVPTPKENFDFANNNRQSSNLDTKIQRLDLLVRKGTFLRRKPIQDIHETLQRTREVSPSQALFLLRCCGGTINLESDEVRNKLVSDLWATYQKIGLPVDISHYNALLQVYLENEFKFSPLEFLTTLNEKKIEPNRITYNRLISRYCQEGDIEGANKILEFMKEKQLPINENIFNSLILGNSRANDLEGARNIIEVMKQSQISPSQESYATLLLAYAEHGDIENMNKLLCECEEKEITISNKGFMEVIYALATKNFSEHIPQVLAKVKKGEGYTMHVTGIISRLLYAGQDEVAFEIYKSLPKNAELQYMFQFFPKQLVLANLPMDKVKNYCKEIHTNGWNILAFENVLEVFLLNEKFEEALAWMKIMKEMDITLREHFSFPLFCSLRGVHNRDKILLYVGELSKMGIKLGKEALSYIISALNPSGTFKDTEDIYTSLLNCQGTLDINVVYNSLVQYLLENLGVKETAQFVIHYQRGIHRTLGRFLGNKYLESYNVEDTVTILRQMLPFSVRFNESSEREVSGEGEHADDGGYGGIRFFLKTVVSNLIMEGNIKRLMPLLKEMELQGVGITQQLAGEVKGQLGKKITGDIEAVLEALASPSLTPLNGDQSSRIPHKKVMLQWMQNQESKGELPSSMNIPYLISLAKQNNIEAVEEQINKMKSQDLDISPTVQVILIQMYTDCGKLEEAENLFNRLKDNHPEFQVHAYKVINYAHLLVKRDRIQDAAKALLMYSPENGDWNEDAKPTFKDKNYSREIKEMLMALVEKKDLPALQLMQEALVTRKYCFASDLFQPLIQYYIQEDNLEEAIKIFEQLTKEHSVTVGKEELIIACIEKEDTEKLQALMDISSRIHGEMNVFYDLMFAFVELGRVKQAKKILETSGLRTLQNRLESKCDYYLRNGKIAELEILVDITKDLFNINRQNLFNFLLDGHIARGDADKALEIWTSMQEEGVEPTDSFLIKLSNFLQRKGMEVPFVVPSGSQQSQRYVAGNKVETPNSGKSQRETFSSIDKQLLFALDTNNSEAIGELVEQAESQNVELSPRVTSRLIKWDIINNNLKEATERTRKMILRPGGLSSSVMEVIIKKLAEAGEVENILFFEKYMNKAMKRQSLFNFHLSLSYVNSNRIEEYLHNFLKGIEEGSSIDATKLHSAIISHVFNKEPQLYPLLEKCADAEVAKGSNVLYQWIWDYAFSAGNTSKAEEIYGKHLENCDSLSVKSICGAAFRENKPQLLDDALKVINRNSEGRRRTKGALFSGYIDNYRAQGQFKEAIECIEKSLKDGLTLRDYYARSLRRLQSAMKEGNIAFPYEIPKRVQSKESSSSSSDSD